MRSQLCLCGCIQVLLSVIRHKHRRQGISLEIFRRFQWRLFGKLYVARAKLLTNTKCCEDFTEQIVGSCRAYNFSQALVGNP